MRKRKITETSLDGYRSYLEQEEKGANTVRKYLRDLRKLMEFAGEKTIDKDLMIAYKTKLIGDGYKICSVNSFLVAANRFLEYMGWQDARVRSCRTQRESFRPEERCLSGGEYGALVKAAREQGKERLCLILQTVCATGMRIGELRAVTAGGVKKGVLTISNKGKTRKILLPDELRGELLSYMTKERIGEGIVFRTSTGKPVDRSNVWREMKALGKSAGVDEKKIFPHNLRRLFAKKFHEMGNDIAALADILGHGSIETTRIYIRTTEAEHRGRLNRMKLVYPVRSVEPPSVKNAGKKTGSRHRKKKRRPVHRRRP